MAITDKSYSRTSTVELAPIGTYNVEEVTSNWYIDIPSILSCHGDKKKNRPKMTFIQIDIFAKLLKVWGK